MVFVNGKKILIYNLDNEQTILERIASKLNTLPKFLFFMNGIPTIKEFHNDILQIEVEDLFKLIKDNSFNENFSEFYDKIKSGIILIFQNETVNYETIQSYYDKKILGIVFYNLDNLFANHTDIANTFQEDYIKIKNCVLENNVTQAGQQYLHIHKHGCKGGLTRAFGFTNKFLTKLVSIYLNIPLIVKGRSAYIEF